MGVDCRYSPRCDGACPEKDIKECGAWYHFRFPDAEVENNERTERYINQAIEARRLFDIAVLKSQKQPRTSMPRIAA